MRLSKLAITLSLTAPISLAQAADLTPFSTGPHAIPEGSISFTKSNGLMLDGSGVPVNAADFKALEVNYYSADKEPIGFSLTNCTSGNQTNLGSLGQTTWHGGVDKSGEVAFFSYGIYDCELGAKILEIRKTRAIAPQDIPLLKEALKSPFRFDRSNAAGNLAALGPAAAPATTELLAALDDQDEGVVRYAAAALAKMKNKDALKKINQLLDKPGAWINLASPIKLYGKDAAVLVPKLDKIAAEQTGPYKDYIDQIITAIR